MTSRSDRTRQRLQQAALELVTRQGYDATTVTQIAAAAGVSHMTFFRYFPTKESVLLDDPYDPLIAEAVAAQPLDLPPLERVRRGLLAAWGALPEPEDAATRARVAVAAGHAGLRAKAWENTQRTEELIVETLTRGGAGRLEARIAAGACLGALTAALFDWGLHDDGGDLGSRIRAALDALAPAAARA